MSSERTIKGTKAGRETAKVLYGSDKRYICHEGGARSGKTYGILQVLIQYAVANKSTKITVVSHSLPHLKRGALRDFLEIIEDWGWYREEWHNKTDNIYHFPNGSWMEFFGLEDPGKARGPGRHILFVNEANLISKALFDQLDVRTTGKVIIDLNPADFDSWCYTLADSPEAVKVHSTYKDNPYISQAQVRVIESYRDADPNGLMWKVYGLGERGASEETIYTHWKLGEMPGKGATWYGLDFGYNVPTALVRVEHYEGAIYVREYLYEPRLTTNDLADRLQSMNIGQYDEIYCDAAEPKTIEELYRAGFNVMPADKDVTEGIRKVKSMPLIVAPDSVNLRKELGSYKWKKDKKDKVLDEPVKENDHLCDALRYAVFTRLKVGDADFYMA